MNDWKKLEQEARRQEDQPGEAQRLRSLATDLRRRARTLGSANALLWGILRIRIEHNAGHWRLALARPNVPPSISQRSLVGAAFGLHDPHWENGNLTKIASITHWTIETEWDESPPAAEPSYIAKLQILIGDIIARWQRTGQRPPHPPSAIAAMYLVKGLDCDWTTGEYFPKGERHARDNCST